MANISGDAIIVTSALDITIFLYSSVNLKCKKANETINTSENAITNESQSPLSKAGYVKSMLSLVHLYVVLKT